MTMWGLKPPYRLNLDISNCSIHHNFDILPKKKIIIQTTLLLLSKWDKLHQL